jgi:outer membrane protein
MKRILLTMLVLLVFVSLGLTIYLISSRPRLAYVRSAELIEKYAGTIEAKGRFDTRKKSLLANIDSLKSLYEKERLEYMGRSPLMNVPQRKTKEAELAQKQNQFYQYSAVIEERLGQEDTEMMGEVLNQINSYITSYAKENNFTMILGTTMNGSLLYADDSMDITNKVLEGLNRKYKGK